MAKFLVKREPHFTKQGKLEPVGAIIDITPPYPNIEKWIDYLEPIKEERQLAAVPAKPPDKK
jgi:hypothetical protein